MSLLITIFIVFLILVLSELLWRTKKMRGESARKFVHICVGTFVAFWPLFMTWREIQFMALAFLVVIVISWRVNFFRSVHEVRRHTWGEVFFPIGIGISALLEPPALIFAAAILHLSLADGFAAVIGVKYGMKRPYKIRTYTKTLLGTITFWTISTAIILVTVLLSQNGLSWPLLPLLVWLPLTATVVENVAVAGTDNIFVPLLIIGVLQLAHIT